MKEINLKIPKHLRKGQEIFNFLGWLLINGHAPANRNQRLADTFHLDDEKFDKLWEEYSQQYPKISE